MVSFARRRSSLFVVLISLLSVVSSSSFVVVTTTNTSPSRPLVVRSTSFDDVRVRARPATRNDGDDETFPSNERRQRRRREFLKSILVFVAAAVSSSDRPASAEVVDQTSRYAADGSAYSDLFVGGGVETRDDDDDASARRRRRRPTDEYTVVIPASALRGGDDDDQKRIGIELAEAIYKDSLRVYVRSVAPGSIAASFSDGGGVRPESVVVSVNGSSTERTNAAGVRAMVRRAVAAGGDVALGLRDPAAFDERLRALGGSSEDGNVAVTRVAPEDDAALSVERVRDPPSCRRPAETDDLLEIAYTGTVVDTGRIFDGSAVSINGNDGGGSVPGRGGDVSVYLVLGRQTAGQFPPGWDVGLRGMCVGERRRITVPPVLAYGKTGVPRRGIPPDATLRYDVSLVSINGLATPQ